MATRLLASIVLMLAFGSRALPAEAPADGKYISGDRSFELSIPPGYRLNKPNASYIPICRDGSLACISYPQDRFKGTTFEGASVEVMLLPPKTEKACLNPGKYEVSTLPEAEFRIDSRSPRRVIGGIPFLHAWTGGAASSHDLVGDRYRGFSHGKCYELSVSVTFAVFGVYDPGTIKEFTVHDQKQVSSELTRIIDSFRSLP